MPTPHPDASGAPSGASPGAVPSSSLARPRRVALVVGAGGVKCAAAIGMYRALTNAGIGVSLVVGCSAGALFAALVAFEFDPERGVALARQLWTRDLTGRPDRLAWLRALAPGALGFDERWALRRDDAILRNVREAFGTRRLEEARIPFFVTATDLMTGDQAVLARGSLVDAIRASIAMPFVFAPHRVDGRYLIDGYMSDPMPVGVAIREGADVIVAMGFEASYQKRISTPARLAYQMSSIMSNNLMRASYAFHGAAHHGEVIPIIPRFEQRVGLFDTDKIPYLVDAGERATAEQLPYLRRLLAAPPARPAAAPNADPPGAALATA
jgi:NTE family protein